MRLRTVRVTGFTIASICLFISGIYYDTMANLFLSKNAAIGYLSIIVFLLISYVLYLNTRYVNMKCEKDSEINSLHRERYELREQIRDLKTRVKTEK